MNIFRELLAKLHIAREHMTSEYRLQKRLDCLEEKILFLMNNTLDIGKIRHATGFLRMRQEINLALMRIIDAIARKNNIQCWINYGTLLGAVRHKGFIPWDDDADMSVLRSDYKNLLDAMRQIAPDSLYVFRGIDETENVEIGFSRLVEAESHFFVDLYPFDVIPGALQKDSIKTNWEVTYMDFWEKMSFLAQKEGATQKVFNTISDWLTKNGHGDGDVVGLATGVDYLYAKSMYRKIYAYEDVFPLKRCEFEGCEFNLPARPVEILTTLYGAFDSFPHDVGHLVHPVNASLSMAQLRKIIDRLQDLRNQIEIT